MGDSENGSRAVEQGLRTADDGDRDGARIGAGVALAGMATWTVGVTVKPPMPVLAAALNSLTAVGAVEPAGNGKRDSRSSSSERCRSRRPRRTTLTPVPSTRMVESRCGEPPPVENVVEVIVTFQPVPEPVLSLMVIGKRVARATGRCRPGSTDTLGVALVESAERAGIDGGCRGHVRCRCRRRGHGGEHEQEERKRKRASVSCTHHRVGERTCRPSNG